MKFELVLPALRAGKKIRRGFWSKGSYIEIIDGNIFSYGPYYSVNNIEWVGERADLLSDDWEIYEEPKPKIKKYLVICKPPCTPESYLISGRYYKSSEEFIRENPELIFVQLIQDSEKEFEE